MKFNSRNKARYVVAAVLAFGIAGLGACQTKSGISRDHPDAYHHGHAVHGQETVVNNAPIREVAVPPVETVREYYDGTTRLGACNGTYSLADERSGRIISQGTAFNAPEGLYALDARGNRTGQIINANVGQSLIFRPNCGCNGENVAIETQSTGHVRQSTSHGVCHHGHAN